MNHEKKLKDIVLDAMSKKNISIRHDRSCALFAFTPKQQTCDCWVQEFETLIEK